MELRLLSLVDMSTGSPPSKLPLPPRRVAFHFHFDLFCLYGRLWGVVELFSSQKDNGLLFDEESHPNSKTISGHVNIFGLGGLSVSLVCGFSLVFSRVSSLISPRGFLSQFFEWP